MRRWLYKMSLQKKLLYSFSLLFVVSLSALLIFFFRSFQQERKTELAHMNQYNGQLSLNLDTLIAGTDSFRYMHFSDDRIRNLLCSDDSDIDPENHLETVKRLTAQMTLLSDMGDYVLRATLVTADGRVYGSLEGDTSEYVEKLDALTSGTVWTKETPDYFTEVHREVISLVGYQVVSMVCPVWNITGEEPIAKLYLDLDFAKIINQWYRTADVGQGTEFMVLNENQLLFDTGGKESGAGLPENDIASGVRGILSGRDQEGILTLHGQRCVAAVEENPSTGWLLVQYTPTANLTGRILRNMSVILFMLAAVIVVTAAGGYILSRQVSRPVKVLSQVMGQAAKDEQTEQEIPLFRQEEILWEDEVGQMIHSYNAMARRINDNIIKSYIYKLNQKQTELKMLQFQINPHFLYNALNTISAIAKLQDVDYIPEIASGLSDMFRYNINGKEIVTVREELEQTKRYMSIQSIRFPERFVTRFEVEEGLEECQILKFVLQPIVENAYKYGFSRKRKRDVMIIRGYREEDGDVCLTVEDDGIGMEPEQVERLNASFEHGDTPGSSQGIGLLNVNERLKNYYGAEYGIRVESGKDCYTRVCLRIKYVAGTPKPD